MAPLTELNVANVYDGCSASAPTGSQRTLGTSCGFFVESSSSLSSSFLAAARLVKEMTRSGVRIAARRSVERGCQKPIQGPTTNEMRRCQFS